MSTEIHNNRKVVALLSAGIFGGLATGMVALAWPFILPAFRRIVLPYVPATSTQIDNVLKAIHYKRPFDKNSDRNIIDLGSGDGRIVIACAEQGIRSYGVELNPWLVIYSKYQAYRKNVHQMATFKRKNLFKVDLSEYDKIILFGVESMMSLMEQKIIQDCDKAKKNITLIACRFPLPNWKPYMSFGTGVDQVWLYKYYSSSSKSMS